MEHHSYRSPLHESALILEPDVKSVWGNVLPICEIPVHVDSYWRAMANVMVNVTMPLVYCCIKCSLVRGWERSLHALLQFFFSQTKAIIHHVNALVWLILMIQFRLDNVTVAQLYPACIHIHLIAIGFAIMYLLWKTEMSCNTHLIFESQSLAREMTIITANVNIYIYAFSRRFYPKRLTVHSGKTFFCQYVCSLGYRCYRLNIRNYWPSDSHFLLFLIIHLRKIQPAKRSTVHCQ